MAMAAAFMNVEIVDDGKTTYVYHPAMKQYQKMPHGAGRQGMMSLDPKNIPANNPNMTYTMLPQERVGGRPVYVVQMTQKNAPAGRPGQKILLYVDQGTYRVKQVKISGPNPMAAGSTVNIVSVIQSDTVNAPIPASVFTFKPPAGATEMKGGAFGGMGGPGGPGRPGGPRRPGGR